MASIFEREGSFSILVNAELQHSLWPTALEIPAGWTPVFGPAPRAECLSYVETNWNDIRPASAR